MAGNGIYLRLIPAIALYKGVQVSLIAGIEGDHEYPFLRHSLADLRNIIFLAFPPVAARRREWFKELFQFW